MRSYIQLPWMHPKLRALRRMRTLPIYKAFRYTPKPIQNLGEVATEYLKARRESAYAAEMDAGFDGGEFSGSAHGRLLECRLENIAAKYGFRSPDHMLAVFAARTSDKWVCQHLA